VKEKNEQADQQAHAIPIPIHSDEEKMSHVTSFPSVWGRMKDQDALYTGSEESKDPHGF